MLIVTLFSLLKSDKEILQDSGVDSGVVTDDGEATRVNNQVDYL